AVTMSCATQQARALNMVTASNHLTGELMALVVMHEAVGCGYQYPSSDAKLDTADLDAELTWAYTQHEIAKTPPTSGSIAPLIGTPAYENNGKIAREVKAAYALFDSYRNLKESLTSVYNIKTAALIINKLFWVPLVGPI